MCADLAKSVRYNLINYWFDTSVDEPLEDLDGDNSKDIGR